MKCNPATAFKGVGALTLLVLGGCGPLPGEAPPAPAGPLAEVAAPLEAATTDPLRASPSRPSFGEVCPGAHATTSVILSNRGLLPLRLHGASASDSFAVVHPDQLPITLGRDRSVTVHLRFRAPPEDTQPVALPVDGTLTVTTSHKDFPAVDIPLRATVAPERLSASPGRLDFGDVTVGKSAAQQVDLNNEGQCPLHVGSADVTDQTASIEVRHLPGGHLAPGDAHTILVEVFCDSRTRISGTVQISDDSGTVLTHIKLAGHCR